MNPERKGPDVTATRPDHAEAPALKAEWKTQFLAELSYEVRTPLSGITGMTDLLLETPLSAEQREYVLTARACAEDLLAILDRALDLADLMLGSSAVHPQEFHLLEALRSALPARGQDDVYSSGAPRLCVQVAQGLPEVVVGDSVQVRKLLSEMAHCAAHACEPGCASISVSGEQDGGNFRLVVECDISPAVEPEKHLAVSPTPSDKPASSTAEPRQDGLRLGWSLVYELTRRLGGALWFQTEAGAGCRCKSVIPLSLPGKDGAIAQASRRAEEPKAILLVEDNEIARRVVLHVLHRNRPGYEVDCAADGSEALKRAAERRYDLVFMDLQLPGMDGFETARQLRGLPGYSDTPIVALTANVTPEYEAYCLRRGMAGFIAKPIQSEQLLASVDAVMRR